MPQILLASYAIVWLFAALKPLFWRDWFLENLLVFAIVPVLVGTYRKFRFSNASYLLITLFLTLHTIGAHYTYSEVPLGNWLREGWNLSRNHYDRVVHFTFGLFIAYPVWEVLVRLGRLRGSWSYVVTVHVVLAWSGLFEVVEAVVAHVVDPELGSAYNGIQGDIWDAQKDMSLAVMGAILCMAATAALHRKAPLPGGTNRIGPAEASTDCSSDIVGKSKTSTMGHTDGSGLPTRFCRAPGNIPRWDLVRSRKERNGEL